MGIIKEVVVVERSLFMGSSVERKKEAWVYVERELVAVFSSIADLFSKWDVASEPCLDVLVIFEGQEIELEWLTEQEGSRLEGPEHRMTP